MSDRVEVNVLAGRCLVRTGRIINPILRISCNNGISYFSSCIQNSNNPDWHHDNAMIFHDIVNSGASHLFIELFHKTLSSGHMELFGTTSITLNNVILSPGMDVTSWYVRITILNEKYVICYIKLIS